MIMAVASPQVELLISLFFSEDDVNFTYVSYISTSGITTLHTQDIFLEKIKNHANNLIGDHIHRKQHAKFCEFKPHKVSKTKYYVLCTYNYNLHCISVISRTPSTAGFLSVIFQFGARDPNL